MSIRIMAAVFESLTLGPTDRLVLLALADHAGEDGTCYPSIARLCQRTGLGERAVQTALKRLKSDGQLRVRMGGGRGNSTLYMITINPAAETPFEKPRLKNPVFNDINPAADARNPAADAPEPSVTIIEPSAEKRGARASRLAADWFLPMEWGEWAISEGMDRDAVRVQADRFKDYWLAKAGKDATKLDWQATWRNWIRSAKERGNGNGNRGGVRQREGAAFGRAIHQLADGLSAGTVKLDVASRDPFA